MSHIISNRPENKLGNIKYIIISFLSFLTLKLLFNGLYIDNMSMLLSNNIEDAKNNGSFVTSVNVTKINLDSTLLKKHNIQVDNDLNSYNFWIARTCGNQSKFLFFYPRKYGNDNYLVWNNPLISDATKRIGAFENNYVLILSEKNNKSLNIFANKFKYKLSDSFSNPIILHAYLTRLDSNEEIYLGEIQLEFIENLNRIELIDPEPLFKWFRILGPKLF